MFDSRLSYNQVRAKFRWQASKRLEDNAPDDDNLVIKDLVNRYNAFFGKIELMGRGFFFMFQQRDGFDECNRKLDRM
jgi:hypothetical protein